jgi:hypothetical protein
MLVVVAATGKTVFAGVTPAGADEAWALACARARDRNASALRFARYERAMTMDETLAEWRRNGNEKSNMGNYAHLQMELWCNSEPAHWCSELRNGLTFLRDHLAPRGVKVFRTEWEIHADTEAFAGSVDFVGIFPDGSLIIADWKRTVAHDVHSPYRRTMQAPLSHIHDTDVAKFTLQISTYMWMIEKYYGHRVSALALCSIHPEHPFHMFAPYLSKEVEFLMAKRRERVACQTRLEVECANDPTVPRCALTGDIAWDPVRVGGELCNAKDAAWLRPAEESAPDEEARARVAALEASVSMAPAPEELALTAATPWVERVPAEGVREFRGCRDF